MSVATPIDPQTLDGYRIVDLEQIAQSLPDEERAAFERLYAVSSATGRLVPPEHMHRWIVRYFGAVENVTEQRVVRVTNRWTLEGALFNGLRAQRPLEARIPRDLAEEIQRASPDPFDEPLWNTPEDVFGRIESEYCVTASNIAKYDGLHGVVIFREHDPLAFTRESVRDALDVSQQWFAKSRELDASAVYPLIMWNCLWKSGASIPHGHLQVSLTRGMHYSGVERLRQAAVRFREAHQRSYFDDLFAVHEALGLGRSINGVRVMANIAPLKEKECVLMADALDETFADVIYDVLATLTRDLNVASFNLVVWHPPFAETGEDWSDMPVIVHMVDRGDPMSRTADFGAMELYASSVVSSDPFRVAQALWNARRDTD